jgi:hypothetical protein
VAKKDDLDEKVVDPDTVRKWAERLQCEFFVTSRRGVTELFDTLIHRLVISSRPVLVTPKLPFPGQAARC